MSQSAAGKAPKDKGNMIEIRREYALAAVILLIAAAVYFSFSSQPAGKPLPTPTPTIPPIQAASVHVVRLAVSGCSDCFDTSLLVQAIQRMGVQVSGEKTVAYDSEEGKNLTAEFRIAYAPTLIAFADAGSPAMPSQFTAFMENQGGGAYVYRKMLPVLFDLNASKFRGRVDVTLLDDPACLKCSDPRALLDEMKAGGVVFNPRVVLDANASQGRDLEKKYGLALVPTVVFSDQLGVYFDRFPNLKDYLVELPDGAFTLKSVLPPFHNLTSDRFEGYVTATFLTDSNCPACYDPAIHETILTRRGVVVLSEQTFDVRGPKGHDLRVAYNITHVPTAVFSADLAAYLSGDVGLSDILSGVYTRTADGKYFFSNFTALPSATYSDLGSGKIVAPANATGNSTTNGNASAQIVA